MRRISRGIKGVPGLAGTFLGHRVWWEKMEERVLVQTMARSVANHLKRIRPPSWA